MTLELLGFLHDSIGWLMMPDYIAVGEDWTMTQVFDYIREHGARAETVSISYVVDEQDVLLNGVHIREFLVAEPTDPAVRNNILECLNMLQSHGLALVDSPARHQRGGRATERCYPRRPPGPE